MSTELTLTQEQEKQVQERLQEQEKKMREESHDMVLTEMSYVLHIMKEHFGEEAYQVFAKKSGENNIRPRWSKTAEESGDNSIEALKKHCWGEFPSEDMMYTTEETEAGLKINCTKCGWHERAKRLGNTEQMFYIICATDPYAVEGFNPNMGLKRTKTLMQGDDCCDFYYYYKDKIKSYSSST
jgi:hypothetical protein